MNQDLFHLAVTIANAGFTAFRIAAPVPQLIAIVRNPGGARAISVLSWVLFALANASNAVYALVMAGDWLIFGINLVSAASCTTIAAVARYKQRRGEREGGPVTAAGAAPPARPPRAQRFEPVDRARTLVGC